MAELTRWEPGRLMSDVFEEMWAPFAGREFPFGRRHMVRPFEADVVELGDEVRVTAELPGVKREDLDITLENNVLTVSGEKKEEREEGEEGGRYHLMERRWGSFSRSFSLPGTVDPDRVEASFEDGTLTIRVPKTEEARRRRISIGGGEGRKQIPESRH